MPAIVPIRPGLPAPGNATRLESPKAAARRQVCEWIQGAAAERGADALSVGVNALLTGWQAGTLPASVRTAVELLRKGKGCPDRSTLYRWMERWREATEAANPAAAGPRHQGRSRTVWGWEARALRHWQDPAKPAAAEVARRLREEGESSATEPRVRRYLASLPTHELDKQRIGPRLARATRGSHVTRTTERLFAGDIYVGDGHTLDVYLQHPTGKRPWRAELTVWMDVRSRCIVGWWLSEAESAYSTLWALSAAVRQHDHVPAMVHIDNGSGYQAQLWTEEATGLLGRLGISPMNALPYNARAKPVERFFLTLEMSYGKRWDSYCGKDQDPEHLANVLAAHKRGERMLPTADQWIEGFQRWLVGYHSEQHPEVPGRTRAQVWAETFEASPPAPTASLFWPRVERIVDRQEIRLDGRLYKHPALAAWNKTDLRSGQVWVEYDIHDDRRVRVLAPDGRWICDAELKRRRDYVTPDRIEAAREKRRQAQERRLELHLLEVRDRAALTVDAAQALDAIEDQTGEITLLEAELSRGEIGHDTPAPDEPELDIWSDD